MNYVAGAFLPIKFSFFYPRVAHMHVNSLSVEKNIPSWGTLGEKEMLIDQLIWYS